MDYGTIHIGRGTIGFPRHMDRAPGQTDLCLIQTDFRRTDTDVLELQLGLSDPRTDLRRIRTDRVLIHTDLRQTGTGLSELHTDLVET
jgi:hypothetical protein